MAIYAFLLAAAALLAAVVLWYLDARQRSSHDQKTAPPEPSVEPENIEEQDPVTEVSPSETILFLNLSASEAAVGEAWCCLVYCDANDVLGRRKTASSLFAAMTISMMNGLVAVRLRGLPPVI